MYYTSFIRAAVVNYLIVILLLGCAKTDPQQQKNEKKITSFLLAVADNPGILSSDVVGIIGNDSIHLEFQPGTAIDHLIPSIAFDGKSISPANKTAINFSQDLSYTVTAEDGSSKTYTVIAGFNATTTKDIISFKFRQADNPAISSDVIGLVSSDSVIVNLPPTILLNNLKPFIEINGVSILPASLAVQDFSGSVIYTVTASNGSTKKYTVLCQSIPDTSYSKAIAYITGENANKSGASHLYAIDVNSGKLKWYYNMTQMALSTPTYWNGNVYFGDSIYLTVVDGRTGKLKWRYTTANWIQGDPIIADGIVYFVNSDLKLFAIDATDGHLIWSFDMVQEQNAGSFSSPTVVNGILYVASFTNHVYAIDAKTGLLHWEFFNSNLLGGEIEGGVSMVNNTVYVGDLFHNMLAINATTGASKWIYQQAYFLRGSPTVDNGKVYITDQSGIQAIDADSGTLVWNTPLVMGNFGSPIVVDGVVYASIEIQNGGLVYALDANTGEKKWMYSSDRGIPSSPTIYDGILIIGGYANIIALKTLDGSLKWKLPTLSLYENVIASACIVDDQGYVYHAGNTGDVQ